MELHYDPAYERSSRKDVRPRLGRIAMVDLSPRDLARSADEAVTILKAHFGGL